MQKKNIIQEKTYNFAVRIIKLSKLIQKERSEFILSKQLVRAGMSIGANVEESIGAQTKPDFFTKISIAYKECRETNYWLRLAKDTELINSKEFESIFKDLIEIQSILSSIIKTMKTKK